MNSSEHVFKDLYRVFPAYLIHLVLVLIGEVLSLFPMRISPLHWHSSLNVFVDGMARWDSGHFRDIAQQGYTKVLQSAFFPLYPTLMRYVGHVVAFVDKANSVIIAGLIISNLCFLFALFFIYRIAKDHFDARIAERTVLFICVFPTSFFFSAVYSESLFLCLVAAAIHAAWHKHWWVSGALVGLAALTRSTGAFTAISALLILYYHARREGRVWTRENVAHALKVSLFPAVIYVVHPIFLYNKYGNPLEFMVAERTQWGRHFSFPWNSLIQDTHTRPLEFLFSIVFIALLVMSVKKLHPALWIYALIGLLVPLVSASGSTTDSMPRFVIVLFPLFMYLAFRLRNRLYQSVYLTANVAFMLVLTNMFANWYWVS